ncbi:MAG TPA: hypothetical protein DCY25_09170 [Bacteroidales bacterium]|nr:hypothetical protein [Bacteroidales bacterium]
MKNTSLILLIVILVLVTSCTGGKDIRTITFTGKSYEQKWAVKDLNPDLSADWSSSGFMTLDFRASST